MPLNHEPHATKQKGHDPKINPKTGKKEITFAGIGVVEKDEERTVEELELFKKRLIEEDRLDTIFRSGQNLTEKFDNRTYLHPHGMTDYDYKCIPEYRRQALEKFKHKARHENYQYLGEHYEIDALMSLFFRKLLLARPDDSVHFAAEYFTRETAASNFHDLLEEEKARLSQYRVKKMKRSGKINTIIIHDTAKVDTPTEVHYHRCSKKPAHPKQVPKVPKVLDPEEELKKFQELSLNWMKKLNIGPLAQDFDTREVPPPEPVVEIKPQKKKPKKKYCGCKDPGSTKVILHPKVKKPSPPETEETQQTPAANEKKQSVFQPNNNNNPQK